MHLSFSFSSDYSWYWSKTCHRSLWQVGLKYNSWWNTGQLYYEEPIITIPVLHTYLIYRVRKLSINFSQTYTYIYIWRVRKRFNVSQIICMPLKNSMSVVNPFKSSTWTNKNCQWIVLSINELWQNFGIANYDDFTLAIIWPYSVVCWFYFSTYLVKIDFLWYANKEKRNYFLSW